MYLCYVIRGIILKSAIIKLCYSENDKLKLKLFYLIYFHEINYMHIVDAISCHIIKYYLDSNITVNELLAQHLTSLQPLRRVLILMPVRKLQDLDSKTPKRGRVMKRFQNQSLKK